MNEKFFDLPRAKQDKMINGAIEIFAKNGFKHASTDDMVKATGVSKGLWFHYFGSKQGLYIFVYEYSVKYMILELSAVIDENENDFFELIKQIEYAKFKVCRSYRYMTMFLENASKETDEEILEKISESRNVLNERVSQIIKKSIIKNIEDKSKSDKIKKMMNYAINGIVKDKIYSNTNLENIHHEVKTYIELFKEITENTMQVQKERPMTLSASMVS